MARRQLTIACVILVAILLAAICGALMPSQASAARPPAPTNQLNVVAPAAGAVFTMGQGQQMTVSWTISSAVSVGYFCVYDSPMRVPSDWGLKRVDAIAGQTSYSTTISVDGDTFGEGGYRHITVKYRTNQAGTFSMIGDSPTILVDEPAMPFMTWPWGPDLTILQTSGVSLPFTVTHADPAASVKSGVITLRNISTGATSVVTLGTSGPTVKPYWIVSTAWPQTPTMTVDFPANWFAPGTYEWWVSVTLNDGYPANECSMIGFLTVKTPAPTKGRH